MSVLLSLVLAQADPVFEPRAKLGDNATLFSGGAVLAVAWSPDGSRLVTSTERSEIFVWNAASGELVLSVSPGFRAESLAVDGKAVVAGDSVGEVAVLDLATLKAVRRFSASGAGKVAVSRNGKRAVAADKTQLHFFDVDGAKVASEPHKQASAPELAISPDGSLVASAEGSGIVKIWKSGKAVGAHRVQGDGLRVFVSFSGDGRRIVVRSSRLPNTILDALKPGELSSWIGYAQIHDAGSLLIGIRDMVCTIDPVTREEKGTWNRPSSDSILPGAVAPDGKSVAVVVDREGVLLLKLPDLAPITTLAGPSAGIRGLAVSPKGDRVAAAADDGTLHVWDVEGKAPPKRIDSRFLPDPHPHWPLALRFSADGASVDGLNSIRFARWSVTTGAKSGETPPPSGAGYQVLIPGGDAILAGGGGSQAMLRVLPLSSNRVEATMNPALFWSASFTPDGSKVLLRGDPSSWSVFDAGGKLLAKSPWKTEKGDVALLLPDGERAVVVGKELVLVELKSGAELRKLDPAGLRGNRGPPSAAAMSPDGAFVALAFWERELHVWALADGARAGTLKGSKSTLRAAEFSRDGRLLVAAGADRAVHVWGRSR